MECQVRLATIADAADISGVVIAALRESNSRDYSADVIARIEGSFSPDAVAAFIGQRKVFVALAAGTLIATASLDGDVVRSVFVHPANQGCGFGRRLIEVIHSTAACAGIETLRVPSSITAQHFYAALGYEKVRDEFHGTERTVVMVKRLIRTFE